MFTVEFESDGSVITSLDEGDAFNDVEMVIGEDDTVFIRQFDDDLEQYQMLYMSYQQLRDLFLSMTKSEGMFYAVDKEN
jgi:hypothetical protein|tara:strand:- start:8 stop:244 length:237 start_codon:yes stop_codon:yes gene_type:complete